MSEEEIDFEKYRKVYEAEEHWRLRRAFLTAHWTKFEEDEIVCLAQVFINMELMGCKYPNETMLRVSKLAEEVKEIKKYRQSRQNNLKRTFIGAQDAVQAKIKKSEAPRTYGINESFTKSSNIDKSDEATGSYLRLNQSQMSSNLRNLLRNVDYYEMPNNDINGSLNKTIALMMREGRVEQKFDSEQNKYFYVFNGQIIGEGEGETKKVAKKLADENLVNTLKANCYTIRSKLAFYSAEDVVRKDQNSTPQNQVDRDKIQEDNLGFKMLRMLGWSGGSLGAKGDGIIDPVKCEIKIGRGGLGSEEGQFDAKHFRKLMKNFKENQVEYDLVFSSEFTKEERAQIHQIAQQMNLRTKSYGTKESRHIVISTKLDPQSLRQKLLQGDPYLLEKYDIIPPPKS